MGTGLVQLKFDKFLWPEGPTDADSDRMHSRFISHVDFSVLSVCVCVCVC